MNKILNWIGVIISIFSAIMIYQHWNDHEVSAWIVAFTGWFNYTLDMMKKDKSNDQV